MIATLCLISNGCLSLGEKTAAAIAAVANQTRGLSVEFSAVGWLTKCSQLIGLHFPPWNLGDD